MNASPTSDRTRTGQRPFVSVVIPTHNRAALLKRLLRSLLEQDYPDDAYEIIVVHNVSPDETEAVVDDLAAAAPIPIRYFAKNYRGPMASRDFGFRAANGSVIAFVDDDCVATPCWIRHGVASFSENVGIVQGRTLPHPEQPRKLLEKTIEIRSESPYYETCNIFYRKEALEAVDGFSREFASQHAFYGEDTDLAWKVKERGYTTAFAAEALVYHEVFEASIREWLLEPRRMHIWPYLVKRHPGLRDHMYLGYFLAKRTALFDVAIVGLLAGGAIHWAAMALVLPYLLYRSAEPMPHKNPLFRLARVIFGLPRACVFFLALTTGSARFRCLLI